MGLLFSAYRVRVRVVERHSAEVTAFNEQLMKAQEQERTRIAGELHDSVMQQITALSLVLGTAKRKLPADSEVRDIVVDVQRKLIDVGSEVASPGGSPMGASGSSTCASARDNWAARSSWTAGPVVARRCGSPSRSEPGDVFTRR